MREEINGTVVLDRAMEQTEHNSVALQGNEQVQVETVAVVHTPVEVKTKPFYDFIKRTVDIFVSLICLTVGLPVYLIIAIAIMIDDWGNPFFVQMRTGKNGKHFKMYKFRTMYKDAEKRRSELLSQNEADGPIFKIANDPRVTRVGKFLRKTSLDEAAQVINVLMNDMTIVGERDIIETTKKNAGFSRVVAA